jgi:PleD family two-component response regulator
MAEALTEANRKLERLSTRDGLTGIANRRQLASRLTETESRRW